MMFDLGMDKYFEVFYIQEFLEADSPFPQDWDNTQHKGWVDGAVIMGEFFDGVFTCNRQTHLLGGMVLRRDADELFNKLSPLPKQSATVATSQLVAYEAVVTERGEIL